MPSKRLTKKTVLNPIIIAGFIVIALLLIIIAAMGRAYTPSLKTQIAPSTAPTATPPTDRQCGPQKLLEVVGPFEGKALWTGIRDGDRPTLDQEADLWRLAKADAASKAPKECTDRATETPSIDFYPCPTPSPKPTDYVCIENEGNKVSCKLATSRDLRTNRPRLRRPIISCVKNPITLQRISDTQWEARVECTAVCLCQRACDVKEGTPVDL